MSKLERVNIITPTYNDAHRYLIDTIVSVQRQVLKENNLELVHTIINDGTSNKESIEYLNRIEKIKSVKIINQSNNGLSSARNTGINYISSDYILPLDSDDLISPCYLDLLVSKIKTNKNKNSIAYTNWVSFGRYQRFINVKKTTPFNIRFANYLPVSLLMHTELASNNPYDENMLKGCEDWDLWIRLICNGCKSSHIKFFGFFHREHHNNMTGSTLNKYGEIENYIKTKYPKFYSNEYNQKIKKLYPPNLYDNLRAITNPRFRYFLISKLKIFL